MAPENLGRYEIIAEIGRGGMATVYRAYDPSFDRDVAVKVLPREYLTHRKALARFEREAKAVATLNHPAIVPVYDYGEEDGQPYLVMRYMGGKSLAYHIAERPLSLDETVPLISRIASALDDAHSKGIIHRDIKPDNILVDTRGEAYLADFGLVKLLDATDWSTTFKGMLGTPAYMSPEQVEGNDEPDGRSDIYSLGVVLFETLTGEIPFNAPTPAKMMMTHVLEPVPRILAVNPGLPEGLEAIIARAMAKKRDGRFPTASEMANMLSDVLGGKGVPLPSSVPLVAIAPEIDAEQTHVLRGHKDTVWGVSWAPDGKRLASGSYDGQVIIWDVQSGEQVSAFDVEGQSSNISWSLQGQAQGVRCVAWSPTGRMIVTGSDDGMLTLWNPEDSSQLATLDGHSQGAQSVAWSPDGSLLGSTADDGKVTVWDMESGQPRFTGSEHTQGVRSVSWSPDGKQLVSGSYDRRIIIWDAQTGGVVSILEGHSRGVRSVAWSPDGTLIASASSDGALSIWDAQTGEHLHDLHGHAESVHSLAWSWDSQRLLSGANDGAVVIWDAITAHQSGVLQGHSDAVRSIAWSPNGAMLATGSDDRLVIIWAIPE